MRLKVSDRIIAALLRIFKIFAYIVSTILIFLILTGILTQTPYLKNLIRSYLVSSFATNINGSLHIGRIEGNMISGFSVDSVSIRQEDREVIAIGKIVCFYEPLAFFRKTVNITKLVVDAPRLRLARSANGRWTIADLFKPPVDTGGSDSEWKIQVESFLFRYGTLEVDDATISGRPELSYPDPAGPVPDISAEEISFPSARRFRLDDVKFEGSLSIGGGRTDLGISRMSWYCHNPDFDLQQFSGDFHIDRNRTVVSNMIIRSRKSYLHLDASMERSLTAGIPSLEALKDDSVSLRLEGDNIDYDELRKFLTYIPGTSGSASVQCEADGPFGNLRVSGLRVKTARSDVTVRGLVSRLDTPWDLFLDVAIEPSTVTMRDLDIFISQIPEDILAPDLPISLSGRYLGQPFDFSTDLELEGEFGHAAGHASLLLTADPIAYTASYTLRDFNPGTLFGVGFDSTTLNGRVDLQGAGFTPEEMKTNFFMILDTSVFRGFHLEGLQANGTLTAGTLDAEAHATSGQTVADATFNARFSGDTVAVDNADVSVSSLDLAAILKDSLFQSDITAKGRLSFHASNIDDLNMEAALVLLPSRFREHEVNADSVIFTLDQRDPANKLFRLNSSLATINLEGGFDLDLLSETISQRVSALAAAIRNHTALVEPTASTEKKSRRSDTHKAATGTMDFNYRISINNLLPVGEFFNTTPFNLHGDLSGRFVSDPDHLLVSLRGKLEECYIGTITSGSLYRDATIDLTLGTPTAGILENLTSDVSVQFASGIIEGRPVSDIMARLSYADSRGVVSASGVIDSTLEFRITGQASTQPGAYIVDLDTFSLTADDYGWINDQDVQFRLSDEGLRVMHAVFARDDEEISVRGIIGKAGNLDALLNVKQFDLSVLNTILPYPELKAPGNGFMGEVGAEVALQGRLEAPEFTLTAMSENFVLRKTRLGFVETRMTYSKRRLDVLIQTKLTKADSAAVLTVEGFMPANFSFPGSGERFPDEEQNIRINAANFDISIFDPLISELQNMTGRVNSDLIIGGTPQLPVYSGSMYFRDVNFLFVPNNIPYTMNGTIRAEGSSLVLNEFSVENVPAARPRGRLELSGTITTDRFKLDSFDITGKGNLLVMGEETRRVNPTMYGPLFILTDSNGLNMSGNLSRPFLRGHVLVTDAFITFPPKNRTQASQGFRTLNYVVINDTSAGYTTEEIFLQPFFSSEDSASTDEGGGGRRRPTFLDLLRYDLDVETRGTPSIRFIFSQLSDEVLYAELNGRVSLVNEQGTPSVYGQIEIGAPSYYKFYQRFDATGKLKFVGPWDNPELDIRAIYEASHVTYSNQNGEGEATPKRVQVLLELSGQRYEPVLKMTLREQSSTSGSYVDLSGNSTPAEAQSDAISFILTGKFSNELTSSDRSSIAGDVTPGTGAMVGSILTSSLLTGVLEDYIRKELPFIRSVDVTYEGGSSPGTNVQVSANALKGYLRVGGKILSDVGRASVSYKASLGDIFDASSIRNFFFEIEQRLETESQKNKNTVEGRIYYRFSF